MGLWAKQSFIKEGPETVDKLWATSEELSLTHGYILIRPTEW
jgi:hypothetical protein